MTCFADAATCLQTPLVENEVMARETLRLRVEAPDMSRSVLPGQFFMVRNPAGNDPLIGRAFALYDCSPEGWLDLVFVVKGKLTTSLARLRPGDPISLWGPLGNGFKPTAIDHLIMVAGGIGHTPFLALSKEALGVQQFGYPESRPCGYARRVSFCYGVRSAEYLAGVDDFQRAGCALHIATDDGSHGPPRLVTDTLRSLLDETAGTEESRQIVCCGPEPMMEAVAGLAAERHVPCQVSLETPMACGIGICFSCVAKVGEPEDWDYKRTCVEGPVFDARHVLWR